ncbi:MAG: twin-arginine translocase TatA/TatE family subunit [Victivallales bacterium]|nr:twin-arginine translocase TatA/TatE family subunit [Victivallales bacterium]
MRPGLMQILIVLLIVAVLFGAKKIPELARSIGKAKGEFKKGLQEGEKELADAEAAEEAEKTPAKELA